MKKKKIVTDCDHQPTSHGILSEREYEDGGWFQFERWCGISWFGGHSKLTERYGTIRSDKKIPSRFPIYDKTQGAVNEQLEQRTERFEDFDE